MKFGGVRLQSFLCRRCGPREPSLVAFDQHRLATSQSHVELVHYVGQCEWLGAMDKLIGIFTVYFSHLRKSGCDVSDLAHN